VTTANATAKSITLSCSAGTLSVVGAPAHGTLGAIDQGTKAVTYTPSGTYAGPDSFTFKANDGSDSNVATVSITVQAAPIPPVTPPDVIGKLIKLPPPGIINTVLNGNKPASANFGTGICPPACFIVIQLFPGGKAPTTSAVTALGGRKFTVPKGQKVPLTVKLTKKATALLKKKGKLKITAVIITTDATGAKTTIKRNYTLKVKKKK
jgi:hypothetical protein